MADAHPALLVEQGQRRNILKGEASISLKEREANLKKEGKISLGQLLSNVRNHEAAEHLQNSRPARPWSQPGAQPSGPGLQRSNSLPAHLPSNPFQPTEVKTVRKSITRPEPDTRPPVDFRHAGGDREAAKLKEETVSHIERNYFWGWLEKTIDGSPHYRKCLESIHPKITSYTREQREKAYDAFAWADPKLNAEIAKKRNRMFGIPNYATSRRFMDPIEQKFISQFMQRIGKDAGKTSFHMHGEFGAVGDKKGKIVNFTHSSEQFISLTKKKGDQFSIHSHGPYNKPFDFSPSEGDHKQGAGSSPRPFANHEAPDALNKKWAPPAGWMPPQDYPRD